MKPVFQTRFGNNPEAPGNCFQAAVASILELSLEDLPDDVAIVDELKRNGRWKGSDAAKNSLLWAELWLRIQRFLREQYGLHLIVVTHESAKELIGGGYFILSGESPRKLPHAVVGWKDEIVHDPHPKGGGISPIEHIYLFYAIDPSHHRSLIHAPNRALAEKAAGQEKTTAGGQRDA